MCKVALEEECSDVKNYRKNPSDTKAYRKKHLNFTHTLNDKVKCIHKWLFGIKDYYGFKI